jgi:hypothetical protein
VQDAAEGVLSYIMEHVGAFPSPCGPASSSSLLDEDILMEFLAEDDQVVLGVFIWRDGARGYTRATLLC